jgi:hypothetical protein
MLGRGYDNFGTGKIENGGASSQGRMTDTLWNPQGLPFQAALGQPRRFASPRRSKAVQGIRLNTQSRAREPRLQTTTLKFLHEVVTIVSCVIIVSVAPWN